MLRVVKMLLKGDIGGSALNSHGNYIVDHGKSWNCVFEFLWEPCNYLCLFQVAEACRNLQLLHLNQCNKVTDKGIIAISHNCPRLRQLLLDHCDKVCKGQEFVTSFSQLIQF